MIMEKEGYEFRGYKLGQEVIYKCPKDGTETKTKIIGFDTNYDEGDEFIAMLSNKVDGIRMKDSYFINHVLEGHYNSLYMWVDEENIVILEPEANIPNHKHKTLIYLSENMVWRKKDIVCVELEGDTTISILSKVTKGFVVIEYESNEIRDSWFKKIIEQING